MVFQHPLTDCLHTPMTLKQINKIKIKLSVCFSTRNRLFLRLFRCFLPYKMVWEHYSFLCNVFIHGLSKIFTSLQDVLHCRFAWFFLELHQALLQKWFFTSVGNDFSHQLATDVRWYDVVSPHPFTSGFDWCEILISTSGPLPLL